MKFNVEEVSTFKPITITLESQQEVDYLYALVAGTDGYVDSLLGFESWELHDFLAEHANDEIAGKVDVVVNEEFME
jgi:hypothetical protein